MLALLGLCCATPAWGYRTHHAHTPHSERHERTDHTDEATLKARRARAQAELRAHQRAAAQARAHQEEMRRQATRLARQQVQEAAILRGLEDQTAQDTTNLATLLAAQAAAAARLAQAQSALQSLLPVMQRLATAPATTLLLAPLSPQDSVRGIAIMQGFAAELADEAAQVTRQKAQLASAITQAQAAHKRLTQAVAAQQEAEARLSFNIQQAQRAEQQDINQEVAQAADAARARDELTSLNAAIARLAPKVAAPAPIATLLPAGAGAPVAGHIVVGYGAPTPAGPSTGISYATPAGARVVSPCTGTILYAGPLANYGTVAIADCGGGLTDVLAGMAQLDVSQGQRVLHGQPLGSMQGFNPAAPANEPHLFVQLRQNGVPVDPTAWLAAPRHSG